MLSEKHHVIGHDRLTEYEKITSGARIATAHFAREAYDSVSLRAIASEAGVDVSLVARYFGSKEELFAAVLASCPPPDELFQGHPKDFGDRISRMLVDDPLDDDKFDVILVMLRSASHPAASEAIRQSGEERFYGPFAEWLGGRNANERVRMAASRVSRARTARWSRPARSRPTTRRPRRPWRR